MTFVNHGCNDTDNIDYVDDDTTEFLADTKTVPAEYSPDVVWKDTKYNPSVDRETMSVVWTHRYVKRGDEILGNYLTYFGDEDHWESTIVELRKICSGGRGAVERIQSGERLLRDEL